MVYDILELGGNGMFEMASEVCIVLKLHGKCNI